MFDILFQLKDIETDKREQIYKAEIKKETPYRHKGAETKSSVATSNYTGFGVSDRNDTTGSGELQASEKTDLSGLTDEQKANAEKVLSKLKQKSRLIRSCGKPGYIGYAADRIP